MRVPSQGRGNGYVVTLGGKRQYFSGVTECVPEVQALTNIEVAFLSFNLPHGRMTPRAVVIWVNSFGLEGARDLLQGQPVTVRLADWYPTR